MLLLPFIFSWILTIKPQRKLSFFSLPLHRGNKKQPTALDILRKEKLLHRRGQTWYKESLKYNRETSLAHVEVSKQLGRKQREDELSAPCSLPLIPRWLPKGRNWVHITISIDLSHIVPQPSQKEAGVLDCFFPSTSHTFHLHIIEKSESTTGARFFHLGHNFPKFLLC